MNKTEILTFLLNKKYETVIIETFYNWLQFCEEIFLYISECEKFDE